MQDVLPIALPLFFSNNNRERLFVTSRPSYLQMRASSRKCIMQPPIFANAATHNGSPGISQGKKQIFFSYFLHFGGTFFPLCWGCVCVCVCAGIYSRSTPPPKAELIHLSSGKAGTNARIQPSQFSPSLSVTHMHTHCAFASTRTGQLSPSTPSPPLPTRQGPSSPAPHSPIWILLGKLAPNTAPRKLVQKKAKMCCIFPFALAKKKPSSEHRFDFSPLCSL